MSTYTLRTGTASLVLNSQCNGVDLSPLAQLVALFLTPKPTWTRAISKLHTDASSLRDVQYLDAHHVREVDFKNIPNAHPHGMNYHTAYHTAMDEAAKLGFLSVVQFLHTSSLKGCGKFAMDRAAKYGHLYVVQWLHENRTEGCSHSAMMEAAGSGHLEVVRFLDGVVKPGDDVNYDMWTRAVSQVHVQVVQYLTNQVRARLRQETQSMHPQWTSEAVEDAVQMELVKWVEEVRPGQYKDDMIGGAARQGSTEMVAFLFLNGLAGDCENAISFAATKGHLDIIQFFHVQNADGFTTNAMDWAAEEGFLDLVQFLHGHRTEGCTVRAMDQAAKRGHVNIVQFLNENRTEGCTVKAMDQAAKHGHLDIVQFLNENRREGCTVKAMDQAAKHGHLDIVQFLDTHRHEGCTVEAMDQAAAGGYLDVVQYLHVHRTEGCTSQAMTQAAIEGHLDVVQFLHENRSEGCDDLSEYDAPNDVAMLAYLHTNHLVELDPDDFCSECNLDTLVFLYDHCVAHVTIDKRSSLVHGVLKQAIRQLDLARIQYLDSKRPLDDIFVSNAMDWAAGSGRLDVLTYLHTHGGHGGCTTAAMDNAASNGHLDIVQFLHHHRTEGCTTAAMNNAATNGHLDIVQFLHHHRFEGCTTAAMDNNWKGRLDIIQFLHENRSEGCTTNAMDTACYDGHLDIVQFLHLNRSEGCTARALENAASMGWLEIAQFLCANRPNESCVVQGLKVARRDKQRYMIEFLESQLPCACLRCVINPASTGHITTADAAADPIFFGSGDY